jgi:tripartite-type tricarboxylate transporter receptor subunit TctC
MSEENCMPSNRCWAPSRRAVLTGAGLALVAAAAPPGRAGTGAYPTRPITLVVPYTPGSGPDILARSLGPFMSSRLGQPVVVDNRVGASGTIGTASVVRAPNDGYTLLVAADTLAMTPSLYRLTYSPAKDLTPVARVATGTLALLVNPALGVNSVAELVNKAKRQPGRLAYASPGVGTPQHIAMELFKQASGTFMLHIPYKGMSGAITDLIGGQTQLAMVSVHVAMPHVNAGKLKMLAVADGRRSAVAPAVPTFTEAGYPELSRPSWMGFFAPAGTPGEVVGKLNATLVEALAQKEVQQTLSHQGLTIAPSSPAELGRQLQEDIPRWERVVRQAGITAE